MVRIRRMALALGAAAIAGVCVANAASAAKPIHIAEFYYNPSPYGIASYKSAQVEAKKLGVSLTVFDANNDPEAQITQMEDAITSGKYQAFWVWALNGVAEAHRRSRRPRRRASRSPSPTTRWVTSTHQLTLSIRRRVLVSTIGGSIGKQQQAFVTLIQQACKKQVGSGTCNVAFMPGLANYPTDTLRENYMQGIFNGTNIHFTLTPPGMYDQPTSQQVALTYFQSKPNVQVFCSFGDQMTAGALTAFKQLGITPGKDLQVCGSGGTNELVADIKAGTVFGTVALYPSTESYIGIKDLVAAIHGKKVPSTVNVIDKNHPLIITKATLATAKGFKPDWSLTGNPG